MRQVGIWYMLLLLAYGIFIAFEAVSAQPNTSFAA